MNDIRTQPRNKKPPSRKSRWFKRFQKIPRPLLRWISAILLPYGFLSADVSESKFSAFLIFLAALYGIRGIEQKIETVMGKEDHRNHNYEYREEPIVDYSNDVYTDPQQRKYHTVSSTNHVSHNGNEKDAY